MNVNATVRFHTTHTASNEVCRKHTTAHNGSVVCRHSRCAVVRQLIVVIYCPTRGSDSVRSTG